MAALGTALGRLEASENGQGRQFLRIQERYELPSYLEGEVNYVCILIYIYIIIYICIHLYH